MSSTPFFIGDLHLGHKKILEFSSAYRGGTNVEEHDEWIVKQWNSVVTKRDIVYVVGDVAFNKDKLVLLKRMNGQKNLVRGNHDTYSLKTYMEYFNNVYGLLKKWGYWISHPPIHPQELRGKHNIHGHVHHNSVTWWDHIEEDMVLDPRYVNVSVENNNGVPVSLDEINKIIKDRFNLTQI